MQRRASRRVVIMCHCSFKQHMLLHHFTEAEVLKKLTLSKELIMVLFGYLKGFLEPTQCNNAIPPTTKLLAVLHFLGKVSLQVVAGEVVGVSPAFFLHLFTKTLQGFSQKASKYIQMHTTRHDSKQIKNDFYGIVDISNVMTVIDCTFFYSI